ncbi:SUMF1/EgtB/PvdO family nonheme iron enzyme [Candidatus Amarolinea dominans]|uniref:SUMF1/EgtB/PvdO family nonheme iron enzyme n=1 Tax=Candidatus Amarolinea dominans TaxID=3140696 RepID=UPI0031367500|nr:SUMF1/EgtB/PvdO family nonheme iron enzyme [Anaerolineae bacterium]
MTTRPSRPWLLPALIALILAIGNLAANLVAADLQETLKPVRGLVWGAFVISLAAAVWIAVREARRPADPAPGGRQAAKQYEEQRRRYLQRIAADLRFLPLTAVDIKAASAETPAEERLPLADVYVALDTKTRVPTEDPSGRKRGQEEMLGRPDERPWSALEAVAQTPRLVLVGEPGGGKSTFVNHLAYCLANAALDARGGWLERLPTWPADASQVLPVPVTLRYLAAWLGKATDPPPKTGLLLAYLASWLGENGLGDCLEFLTDHLQDGAAILLLDGLDEVPVQAAVLGRIKEMINDLSTAYPSLRVVVTCRVLSYQDRRWHLPDARWPTVVELAPLDDEKMDAFITAWYRQLASMRERTFKDAETSAAKLSRAVRREDLRRLARNPLLLTTMAVVHTRKNELPDARVLLYRDVVDLLLSRWEAVKLKGDAGGQTTWRRLLTEAGLQDNDVQQALWRLAYEVHAQLPAGADRETTADVTMIALEQALADLHPQKSKDWAEQVVAVMNERAGLLVEVVPGQLYRFPHRTFQEYLAACQLSSQGDFVEQAKQLAGSGALWREVILLAVGNQVQGNRNEPLLLVDELCPKALPASDAGWRQVWLAGQVLLEISLPRAQRRDLGSELIGRVRQQLTHLITHDCLTPRERAEAGSVLSVLGDPRDFDVLLPVPAGEFTMGSNDSQWEDEKPAHPVWVGDFRIGAYPVTNAQYEEFVLAANHEPPVHWRGHRAPVELRNHPVVYVGWDDANAYCAWRSRQEGRELRLPTEAEWEKAARGADGRTWPWGNTFDAMKCNMGETGIGDTSPVGIFAAGRSPYEVFDMAGNVWEWTRSAWGEDWQKPEFGYPYRADDGREDQSRTNVRRVVRGGSFIYNDDLVRCAYRVRDPPGARDLNVGFRVVAPGL